MSFIDIRTSLPSLPMLLFRSPGAYCCGDASVVSYDGRGHLGELECGSWVRASPQHSSPPHPTPSSFSFLPAVLPSTILRDAEVAHSFQDAPSLLFDDWALRVYAPTHCCTQMCRASLTQDKCGFFSPLFPSFPTTIPCAFFRAARKRALPPLVVARRLVRAIRWQTSRQTRQSCRLTPVKMVTLQIS